jgi:hypothetical protein
LLRLSSGDPRPRLVAASGRCVDARTPLLSAARWRSQRGASMRTASVSIGPRGVRWHGACKTWWQHRERMVRGTTRRNATRLTRFTSHLAITAERVTARGSNSQD